MVPVTMAILLALPGSTQAEQPAKAATSLPAPPATGTLIRPVDPKRADELIQQKKVVILDIRTPKEFAEGHIAGAKNIDFRAADFEKQISVLDRTPHYLVHCASGGRSTQSLEVFKRLHFRSIVHLDGGIKAWQQAGKPVVK